MRDLKSDLEICEKATPGPWKPFRDTWEPAIYTKLEDGCRGVCIARLEGLHGEQQRNDANFIAAARTGWPEAIERAIVAESLIENAGKELKEWMRRVNETEEKLKEVEEHNEHLIWSYEEYEAVTKAEIARLQAENAALREENDLQRHGIQQLSAQVAGLRESLAMIRDKPELWKRPKIGGQDKYAGMPPLVRKIDSILSQPNPGADLLAKIAKLEAGTRLIETDMGVCYQDFAWKCDNCSEVWTLVEGTPEDNLYKYCPNCGAKIIEYVPYIEGPADE